MRPRVPAIVACLLLTILRGAAQDRGGQPPAQPQATFRTGIDLIQLDVSVVDGHRMPVRGLTAGDFTILEDGVPQPIAAFTAVDLPDVVSAAAAWQRNVAPDVVSNRFDAQRVVVILLDDFSMSFDPGASKTAKTIARTVIDQLGLQDLGAVVYTIGRKNGQELTTDRSRLTAAVDRLLPRGGRLEIGGPFSASTPNSPSIAFGKYLPSGECLGGDCVTQALQKVAEALQAKPGARKTLVFISPAIRLSSSDLEDPTLRDDLRAAIAAMQQANLNVYHFDPRGLEVGRRPNEDFDIFSAATGGRAVHDTNEPWEMVPQVFRENSSYYLLGFRATARDGRFHRISVKVSRPGVEVRARAGYFARTDRPPKPSKRPEPTATERAISGAMPTGDLPLSVTVAPFAGSAGKDASLVVVAGLDRADDLPSSLVVEMDAVAFTTDWKPARALNKTVELSGKNDAAGGGHFDIGSRLDLKPGRYELRLAVHAKGTDRTGSVYASVTVPDFAKAPVSVSGIVLQREPATPAGDALKPIVPATPTTVREFDAQDRVAGTFRVYQGGRQRLVPVRLTLRIVDDRDRAVVDETSTADATSFGTNRWVDRSFVLPIDRLPPGAYMLSITATAGKSPPVERTLTFIVR